MVEVLRSTFEDQFDAIENAISQSDFIGIDTEFTGLQLNDQIKNSLFDTGADRYKKLRKNTSQFTICQIGLSTFVKDKTENKYVAHTFNFYLFPTSSRPVDVRFTVQASSFGFLRRYKFDFNKFIYEGISYMNEHQKELVKNLIASRAMFKGIERDIDEKIVQYACSDIADFMVKSKDGDIFKLQKDNDTKTIRNYVWHAELRNRFPNIWTTTDSEDKSLILIEKVSLEKRKQLENENKTSKKENEESFLKSQLGFTRVFELLRLHKKPIVGHNMLLDLMLMFDKFYKPLPEKYEDFKRDLHGIFPVIYDTKHITSSLKKPWEDSGLIANTTLEILFNSLSSQEGQQYVIHSPAIVHAPDFERYKDLDCPHEAGYDAFICGYVFLRLSHIATFKEYKSTEVVPCTFRRYLQTMSQYANRINMIRATVNYIQLDDKDPDSLRPTLLYVKSKQFVKKLDVDQLAMWFSPYGSVDIRLDGRQRALVATGNWGCARDILKSFRNHDMIYVTKYNMWRHSRMARNFLWAGTLVSGGLCVWVLMSSRKQH